MIKRVSIITIILLLLVVFSVDAIQTTLTGFREAKWGMTIAQLEAQGWKFQPAMGVLQDTIKVKVPENYSIGDITCYGIEYHFNETNGGLEYVNINFVDIFGNYNNLRNFLEEKYGKTEMTKGNISGVIVQRCDWKLQGGEIRLTLFDNAICLGLFSQSYLDKIEREYKESQERSRKGRESAIQEHW